MATTTYYLVKGEFKTARLQREITLEYPVSDAAGAYTSTVTPHVGMIVKVYNGVITPVSSTSSAAAAKAAVTEGNYIIAQSDVTIGDGHIPVENRNYKYSDKVALTASGSVSKRVAVYRITNLEDIIIKDDGTDSVTSA